MNPHYAYVYDDFLSDRAYERAVANVETRCSALGIQGRVVRLAIFRSAREMVEGLVRDGAETIVVVGNDHSLEKVMWFFPDLPVTVGYIPVADPCAIGGLLGIPKGDAACDVLAGRRIEALDVGVLDDRYFLTEVRMDATKAAVDIEGRYRMAPRHAGTVHIRNLGMPDDADGGVANADARDGLLEVVIRPMDEAASYPSPFSASIRGAFTRLSRLALKTLPSAPARMAQSLLDPQGGHSGSRGTETRMTLKTGAILSDEPVDILVDGHRMNGFTFRLGIVPRKLKIITGRDKKLDPIAAVGPITAIPSSLAMTSPSRRMGLPVLPKPATAGIVAPAKPHPDGWRNWYTR